MIHQVRPRLRVFFSNNLGVHLSLGVALLLSRSLRSTAIASEIRLQTPIGQSRWLRRPTFSKFQQQRSVPTVKLHTILRLVHVRYVTYALLFTFLAVILAFVLPTVAPLCYIYEEAEHVYFMLRAMYIKYWSRLHRISSHSQGLVSLSVVFERLLQELEPELWIHCINSNIEP